MADDPTSTGTPCRTLVSFSPDVWAATAQLREERRFSAFVNDLLRSRLINARADSTQLERELFSAREAAKPLQQKIEHLEARLHLARVSEISEESKRNEACTLAEYARTRILKNPRLPTRVLLEDMVAAGIAPSYTEEQRRAVIDEQRALLDATAQNRRAGVIA